MQKTAIYRLILDEEVTGKGIYITENCTMVWILPKRSKRDTRIKLLINGKEKRRSAVSSDEIECKLTNYGGKQGIILDLNGICKQKATEGRDEETLKEACSSREVESLASERRELEEVGLDSLECNSFAEVSADVLRSAVAFESITSCPVLNLHSLPTIEEEDSQDSAEQSQDMTWMMQVAGEAKIDATYLLHQTTSLLNTVASEACNACSKMVGELESQRNINGVEDSARDHYDAEDEKEQKPDAFDAFIEEVKEERTALMHETQSLLSAIASQTRNTCRKVVKATKKQKNKFVDTDPDNPSQVEGKVPIEDEGPSESFKSLPSSTSSAMSVDDASQSQEARSTKNDQLSAFESKNASKANIGLRRAVSLDGPMVFARKSSKKKEREHSIRERQGDRIINTLNGQSNFTNGKKVPSEGKGLRRVVSLGNRVFPSTRTLSTKRGKEKSIETDEESVESGLSQSPDPLILFSTEVADSEHSEDVEQAKKLVYNVEDIVASDVSQLSELSTHSTTEQIGTEDEPCFELEMQPCGGDLARRGRRPRARSSYSIPCLACGT